VDTDFRKHFESPEDAARLRTAESVERAWTAASAPDAAGSAAKDATAVTFPYSFWVRLVMYSAVAGAFGFVAHIAFTGDPARDLGKILIGCAGVLAAMGLLPGSIVLDERGIHQVYCMGLYEYTIAWNAILSYRQTTRAELRREGKLKFSWGPLRYHRNRHEEHEQVVIVTSKYGGRDILHSGAHRGPYRFIEELEKRGVPAHGYEGWAKFMADRGFPPGERSR
jgi:hypothetical protein